MRRLATAACAALALGTLLVSTAAGAPNAPRLTEVGGAKFPERAFLLTLPADKALTTDQVTVTENGKAVSGVSVTPAAADEERRFGAVLLIDASNSMEGRPIVEAMAAARAFSSRRNDNQELAVVTFNNARDVVLPFTDDAAAIDDALSTAPTLARGTTIYDALNEALALVEKTDLASASIVLLSDGRDIGSTTESTAAIERARKGNVRVFSVGLRSPQYDARALRTIAEGAGGSFTEASSPEQLEPILDALGAHLAAEYVLRYRSLAGPGADVQVVAHVDDFEQPARSGYHTPALPKEPAAPSFERSPADNFWRSGLAMFIAAVASSVLLALAVGALFSRRKRGLVSRISAFVSVAQSDDPKAPRTSLSELMSGGAEKSLERFAWWSRFREEVEIAKIKIHPTHIVLVTAFATVTAVSLVYVLGGAIFAVLALGVPWVTRTLVQRQLRRQRKLFAAQLPDNLQVLGSALRAGHSFVGALSVVVDDSAEPSRSEFRRVIADERLGVPLETTLDVVARRMGNRDVEQVSIVAALQRMSGGNSAEVLDRVAETVRERGQIRRMVQTLTAQGRMARWVITSIPVVLLGAFAMLNPEYMSPLFNETMGRFLLVFSAVMITIGSLVIKRIIEIKI